jgi:hypothetical protein
MVLSISKCIFAIACLACLPSCVPQPAQQGSAPKTVLFEVVRNSWGAQRDETLLYLRVYSDGSAEANPMWKVDFRNIELKKKQLPSDEVAALRSMLIDPATGQLQAEYSRYWGNKDFGYKYDIAISASAKEQRIALVNFQPFAARNEGKPYPQQVEKLGCSIWRLRAEVSGEPLEKDWISGCAKLGY